MFKRSSLARQSQPQSEPDDPASDFAAVQAEYGSARDKDREILARIAALKALLALGRAAQWELDDGRLEWAHKLVQTTWGNKPPKAKHGPGLLEAAEEELWDNKPVLAALHDRWAAAKQAETNRLAIALQPAHRKAVRAVADAIEALSVAIEQERGVRQQLAETAPEPRSAYLPDLTTELRIGSLTDHNSIASAWARAVRKIGILG